jgi:hypothetical protein
MKWIQFSIGQLMVLIVYAAIGLSAFQSAGQSVYSKTMTEVFYMLTLGLLIVASLTSVFREGRSRARWLGFALFGWMHLKYGWPDAAGPAFDVPFRPRFPHTRVIQDMFIRLGILFAGSAQQGMERWSVIQSALIVTTGLFGMILGDLVARSGSQQQSGSPRSKGDWLRATALLFPLVPYAMLGAAAYRFAWDFRTNGRILDNAYFLATVSALSLAALVASVRQGLSRARCLAFALFGWVHIEFGWPDSTLNPLGVPWRPEFPHVFGLAVLLKEYVSPDTSAANMFRWHVVQSTLTIATAAFGSLIVNLLPLVPTPARLGEGTSGAGPART